MITLHSYTNNNDSIKHILAQLTANIERTIQQKNHCVLALAGGNTPKPLYDILAKQHLPWDDISITLTDERWVAADHKDSNANMIKHRLLNTVSATPHFIPLIPDSFSVENETVEAAIIKTNERLNQQLPNLDIVVLGMGEDGHFASIFPEVNNVDRLLSLNTHNKCLAVSPSGKQDRISLTYAYLMSAKTIFLLISGEEKKAIINGILDGAESHKHYPIWTLLNQTICPVQIYWNA